MASSDPPATTRLKKILKDIIQEIVNETRMDIAPDLSPGIEEALLLTIDELFDESMNVKLAYLHRKEAVTTSTSPAWRPTTGTVDMIPIEADILLYKKQLLTIQLQKMKSCNIELEQKLLHSKSEMEEISEKMCKLIRDT